MDLLEVIILGVIGFTVEFLLDLLGDQIKDDIGRYLKKWQRAGKKRRRRGPIRHGRKR